MPNGNVNTYVTRIELRDSKIFITVQVDEFKTGEAVEISGQATQANGAFATFYDIQNVPGANGGAGWNGGSSLTVTAQPVTAVKFAENQDITVVARVAKVWVTVLAKDKKNPNPNIKAWTAVKAEEAKAFPRP